MDYHISMDKQMLLDEVLTLCPSLIGASNDDILDAITRMCIAHQLNGGTFEGHYLTAVKYLQSINQ